ncbi:MAG TPA: hypothetical protein VHX66_11990 [Solirubrobacteraceae bacterium]|jgi:hypothetical protein|nr:hypothetical protein [Solirubrobacteraceae bacterium]
MSEGNEDIDRDDPQREDDAPPPGQAPVDDPSTGEDEPAEDDEGPNSAHDASVT